MKDKLLILGAFLGITLNSIWADQSASSSLVSAAKEGLTALEALSKVDQLITKFNQQWEIVV